MSASYDSTADHLIDRRRLRRKVSFWRVLAFIALALAIGIGGFRLAGGTQALQGPHIARVTLSGLITGDRATLNLIEAAGRSNASAIILSIDSPGGTVTGSERLYEEIRRLSARKPVAAVINNMGASGAYVAALGAERIFSHQNSLVGSIGVLIQMPNVAKLLDTVGVRVEAIRSSPLKAAPNGMEPTSEEARAAINAIVVDSYDWFKSLVRERRKLDDEALAKVTDGRVFTGRQSVALRLVDELGGERAAIAWLEKEKKIPANLRIRDLRRPSGLSALSMASLAKMAGFDGLSRALGAGQQAAQAHLLDGLVAVWHGWTLD
ncbi:MAG: signal peptide peptidase SppA [Alphaproteobacteria bacterium]|nr:signal peptide peptidase SppA [Alphaproteobacteria bacterium]